MADKTIPELDPVVSINENALVVIDTGIETFKMTVANLALYFRESGLLLPSGVTAPFAGGIAPDGWVFADGTAISRSTYVRLFTAIGTTYGIGNGTTTFNVPDLRGRVPAGKDNMGGIAANRLTLAVAGFATTTLGATGGDESYTPAGITGGSQSIAHVHNIAHVHQGLWSADAALVSIYGLATANSAAASFNASDGTVVLKEDATAVLWTGSNGTNHAAMRSNQFATTDRAIYTSGVISPPTGAAGSTSASAAMSTNNTVNGSNFTFTGTATHRVQPTIIMNYIIKT